jgi:hypothetical protein
VFMALPQKTRDEQLCDLRRELRTARAELAEIGPARDFFASDAGDGCVPFAVVAEILEFALGRAETAENLRGDPPRFDSKAFLKKLGLAGTDATKITWTPELVRRALSVYAGFAQEPVEQFIGGVQTDLVECAEEIMRKVKCLECEEAAVARLLDGGLARKQSSKLLPADGHEERIVKYERHLHSLLTSTLHELERLQARRDGGAVPPPLIADVNVTVDPLPG